MKENQLKTANYIHGEIENLEKDLKTCNIMVEHMHNHLTISSSSMSFRLPVSEAQTILIIAQKSLEKELEQAKKEFESL